jgi:hypothetical protein
MSSPTILRVITIDVGCGPCPIPYPRKSTPRAQSRVPRSDSGCAPLSQSGGGAARVWRGRGERSVVKLSGGGSRSVS